MMTQKLQDTISKTLVLLLVLSTAYYVFRAITYVVYRIGYIRGVEETKFAYESLQQTSAYIPITPSPGISPEPTSVPQNLKPVQNITWGGPQLWEAVNKRRKELGVNPLSTKSELCTIASIRLNQLLDLGKLDAHEGFSSMPDDRPDLRWIFESYGNMSEFLAVGGETPEQTVAMWENTLGHSKLLTGGEYVWGCIYAQNTFSVAITAF
jgi:uncharacterized protein YkwD